MSDSNRNNMNSKESSKSPLFAAADRLGDSPASIVRWLLEFSQCDLSAMSAEGYDLLKNELVAFAIVGPSRPTIRRSILDLMLRTEPSPRPLTRDQAGRWRTAILGQINVIFAGGLTEYRLEPIPLIFKSPGPIVMKLRRHAGVPENEALKPWLTPPHDNLAASFEYYAALLLMEHAEWLRQCRDCQTIFLAGKRNQTFCGDNCRGRWNMRRVRKTKPERYGKRGRPLKETKSPPSKRGGSRYGKKRRLRSGNLSA